MPRSASICRAIKALIQPPIMERNGPEEYELERRGVKQKRLLLLLSGFMTYQIQLRQLPNQKLNHVFS